MATITSAGSLSESVKVVSTSGSIHFSGLGSSGTDFDSMIDQLIEKESRRVTILEAWRQSWLDKVDGFKALNTQMLELQRTARSMGTPSKFLAKDATSTNEGVLKVTTDAAADEGIYDIYVTRLAKSAILKSDYALSSQTAVLNNTSANMEFSYTYGTGAEAKTVSVTLEPGQTLKDLCDIINADPDNPGVRAQAINTGNDQFYLQLRGMDTGESKTITINELANGVTGLNDTSAAWTVQQASQDALFSVDGLGITRASNHISDIISGVTINLQGIGSARIEIQANDEEVLEKIRTFVDSINTVRTAILDLTKVDAEGLEVSSSILTGNYGLQMISSMLKNSTASKAIGFDYDDDLFCSLSSVGILTDAQEGSITHGLLVIDEDILAAAIKNNPDEVAALFSSYYDGFTSDPNLKYEGCLEGQTKPGEYEVKYTVSGGKVVSATIGGQTAIVSSDGTRITGQHGTASAGISLLITNLTDGDYTSDVTIRMGKMGELNLLIEDILNPSGPDEKGILEVLESNYYGKDGIVDMINKKIEFEQLRLIKMETRLRRKFAALDTVLGQYEKLQSQLDSQLDQLSKD